MFLHPVQVIKYIHLYTHFRNTAQFIEFIKRNRKASLETPVW